MAYKNQQQFIDALEKEGELVRISTYVNPHLEMAEITDRVSKSGNGGKALLFENTGYDFPVLMNAYGSERRMCMALGVNKLNDIAKEIEDLFKLLSAPKEGMSGQTEDASETKPVCVLDAKSEEWKRRMPGNCDEGSRISQNFR